MNNDLISRSAHIEHFERLARSLANARCFNAADAIQGAAETIRNAPAVDAEVVRHEGNTTFVTTDNLDAYADRIIVIQGNLCKVYYRDSDDAEVEG